MTLRLLSGQANYKKGNILRANARSSHSVRTIKEVIFAISFKPGQLLVELLIAIGLSSIILPALLTGLVASREGKAQEIQRLKAVAYLREGVDAARSIKNKTDNWPNFAVNGTYHPVVSGSAWSLISGAETINGITRQIVISDVMRDSSGNIVSSSGTVDPSTKKVVITISWTQPHSSNIASSLYLSRYTSAVYTDTTVADFNAGVKTATTVTNTAGGEVTLAAGGEGDWCKPSEHIVASLDLPKQGVADAITAIEGKAFVGTGENSSGVSFANVAISNTDPPVPSIAGTFDGYKTNGVFGETDYAYIATDNNSKEAVIIDLVNKDANGKYLEAGYFNAPDNKDGNQVWVSNNIGYLLTNKKLYSFDLSSKNGSRPIIDPNGVSIAGDGTRVVVVGNYAYVTIKGEPFEMQIIDVSNPVNLVIVGQADLSGNDARDIFVNSSGTRAYVVTAKQDHAPEFFIVDTSSKIGNRPVISSYEVGEMNPRAVTVVPGNRAIVVGKGGEEYQVIDITNEATPTYCGGIDFKEKDLNKVNGLSAVLEADGGAYSYIMTGDPISEFKVIEGGPGGGAYTDSGSFESRIFDSGQLSGFNYFSFTVAEPIGSDIKFQVALNSDNATWIYFGPDGTGGTFFENAGAIPLSGVSGTYFRYKAFLSGDGTGSPVLYDTTVNYSY